MRTFSSISALLAAKGEPLGYSQWRTVDQDSIDVFAQATGDHQWIHVDPDRAAEGPYGKTIAHGYLTLALLVPMMKDIYRLENYRMGLNYGVNKVRFPSAVPVDSKIRASAELLDVVALESGNAVQLTTKVIVEVADTDKPACVAESLARYYF